MARWGAREVSPFLLVLIFISTLGPFQFGFHLVRLSICDLGEMVTKKNPLLSCC